VAQRLLARREDAGALSTGSAPVRGLRVVAAVGACAVIGLFVVATSASEDRNPATGAKASRLASVKSHRYAYWKVAAKAFADHPARGLGSGGFAGEWVSERTFREGVRDAHSLYLETAAELGLIGLAALAALIAGIALAARRTDLGETAGAVAGLSAFAAQAGVDWLWEMPAVTLVALVLAGALVARAEAAGR
jgi:O-antigen ligase